MRIVNTMFTITTAAVFLQLLLGGLLTFNFISPHIHIVGGLIVFILAIATMIASIASKPRSRSVSMISIALVLLIILQITLGFDTLDTGSQIVAWVHFINATAIYGAAISGTFAAMRVSQTDNVQPEATQ